MALIKSSKYGDLEAIKVLVASGAFTKGEYTSALAFAAIHGHLEVVKFLVETVGADVHGQGDLPLRWASSYGNLEIVQYLVFKGGANVRALDDDALSWSARNGHLDVFEFLVEAGADIHTQDGECLKQAVYYDHTDIVRYITGRGVPKSMLDDALTYAVSMTYSTVDVNLEIVKYLLDAGADKDRLDDDTKAILSAVKGLKVFQDPENPDCSVCLKERKTMVFVPCGHYHYCERCSAALDVCAVCKSPVDHKIKSVIL